MNFEPFTIAIPSAAIDDLQQRLAATRFPSAVRDDWSHGQKPSFIREMVSQWLNDFSWNDWEQRLNSYPQFLTQIDGQTIHFLHIRSPRPNAIPLILTHGWPSSFLEYLSVIELLTAPDTRDHDFGIAFDLVIPSLPGYGFSTPLASEGWDPIRTAAAWDKLMKGLGYTRYGAVGSDAGALVTRELAILRPEGLLGVHLQQIFAFPSGAEGEMDHLSPFELGGFANLEKFQKYNGYADIQSKRPGTLAYGLVDSPVAQLAWNAELAFGFEGEAAKSFDRDLFLANTSLYWFTATGSGQGSFYLEGAKTGGGYREIQTEVPTAVASFPDDFRSVRKFAERSFSRIEQWTEMEKGGHFGALDAPEAFADDVVGFFSKLTLNY